MNDFTSLIREYLLGDEMPDEARGRQVAADAVARFDRRLRTGRLFFGIATAALFVATVWLVVLLASADPATGVKTLLLYATGIVVLSTGVGMVKGWYFDLHHHIRLLKELRRLEQRLLDRS